MAYWSKPEPKFYDWLATRLLGQEKFGKRLASYFKSQLEKEK